MRIAFISANREKLPDAVIPLGILSMMAATPARHAKLFWDLCFEPDPLETVARNLRKSQPDLVAIANSSAPCTRSHRRRSCSAAAASR